MSFFRAHRRATAFLFALTFVTVSTKGLCLMPAAGGKGDAHACCTKGTETVSPGCCMDGHSDPTAATMTVRVSASAPAPGVATVSPVGATFPFVPVLQFAFGTDRHHSPPPKTILRV